jgi:hypothetical protein
MWWSWFVRSLMAASESCIPADTLRAMVLYTCPARTHGATTPIIKHPCGVAGKALGDAGHDGTPIAGSEAIVAWASRA